MENPIECKVIEIFDSIPKKINLSRKKFMVAFLLAFINSRKVQFREVALHIDSEAKLDSRERQIQAFFKDFKRFAAAI